MVSDQAALRLVGTIRLDETVLSRTKTASIPPTPEDTFVTPPHPDPSSLPVQAGI
jgi:hypothetical protein